MRSRGLKTRKLRPILRCIYPKKYAHAFRNLCIRVQKSLVSGYITNMKTNTLGEHMQQSADRFGFSPGDRVVYTAWESHLHGLAGTVMRVDSSPGMLVHVILDTAEWVNDVPTQWRHEEQFQPFERNRYSF